MAKRPAKVTQASIRESLTRQLEAKGADIALCGGAGEFVLYVKGRPVGKVTEEEAVGKVIEHALHLQ